MALSEFRRLVNKGIGDSLKRTTTVGGAEVRPLIGRLGLGILALAQICTEFDIESHHRVTETAFKATIRFLPYTREEMDRLARGEESSKGSVPGGQYVAQVIPYLVHRPGLRIFTRHIRESFQKVMRNLDQFGNKVSSRDGDTYEPYSTFEKFLDSIYLARPGPVKSLNLRSDYDQLLFGLALASPLAVLSGRNVSVNLPRIKTRQRSIEGFKFSVEVDNLVLASPICLPSLHEHIPVSNCILGEPLELSFQMKDGALDEPCGVLRRPIFVRDSDLSFNLYDFQYRATVGGRPLAFSGYLFQQTGRLYPRDIQGVLLRINNVAIGKYDNSLLTYPYAEGPRFSMVSAEIFVEAGFEDALNVDRDSFNELHPHYIRVQAYLHCMLHELIFPETWGEEKTRNRGRREVISAQRQATFSKSFRSATGKPLGRVRRVPNEPSDAASLPSLRDSPVDFGTGTVEVYQAHPVLHAVRRRKKEAPLVERILIAFERANMESRPAVRREIFYKLLIDIFADNR